MYRQEKQNAFQYNSQSYNRLIKYLTFKYLVIAMTNNLDLKNYFGNLIGLKGVPTSNTIQMQQEKPHLVKRTTKK
jgi:hypothetical protein